MVDFIWKNDSEEPHRQRRIEILKSYPEIKKLFGYDPKSKWISCVLVFSQICMSIYIKNVNYFTYFMIVYIFGATVTQALFLAIHETSHNLMFQSANNNKLFSIFINLPIVFPFSIAFRHYHLDHHKYQGVDGIDTDLPTNFEMSVVSGYVSKLLWMTFQIVMYAIRPLIHGKNKLELTPLLAMNINIQLIFDVIIWKIWGMQPLLYLIACIIVAGGLHPCAGHFLSEHYNFKGTDQETFSYYGYLNWLTWNVGYHNEHHDFPNIPGSRLPKMHRISCEFYSSLETCDSWIYIIYEYLTNVNVGPFCRVKRIKKIHDL